MNRIVEFYESYHFYVLALVIIATLIIIIGKNRQIKELLSKVDELKVKLSKSKVKIAEEEIIRIEKIIKSIKVGSLVKLKYVLTGEIITIVISEYQSGVIENQTEIKRINAKMPLAVSLLNKEVGDIVKFKLNNSDEKEVYLEVLNVGVENKLATKEVVVERDNKNLKNESKAQNDDSSVSNIVLPIELIPNDNDEFLKILLKTEKANITTYYQNGTKDSKIWIASKMTDKSNVIHNLRSRPEFRNPNWQKANILKVVVDVVKNNEEDLPMQNTLSLTNRNQGRLDGEHLFVSYFILDENWFGDNKIITVTFEGGNYDGRKYTYHHDVVYKKTISHYKNLPCWIDRGRFSNSSNIPQIAQSFVTEII